MYAYETPKASEAKSEPAKKSRGGTDPVANRILIGNRGFEDRGSDLLSLKQALMQNIGTEHYTPVSSEDSAVVQLKNSPKNLPLLQDEKNYSRHHIIPDGTMKAFIKTLIKHSRKFKPALNALMQIIDVTNNQYKGVWEKYKDEWIAKMPEDKQNPTRKKRKKTATTIRKVKTLKLS